MSRVVGVFCLDTGDSRKSVGEHLARHQPSTLSEFHVVHAALATLRVATFLPEISRARLTRTRAA